MPWHLSLQVSWEEVSFPLVGTGCAGASTCFWQKSSLWFDRRGLRFSPTPTTSWTHLAHVPHKGLQRDVQVWKEMWEIGIFSSESDSFIIFPINKASVYLTTASEVWFSGCCSCLVKLFTAVHFSQPVQKHLTMKSVTNILFFGYTVPSSPWLNKLERDFQSSWSAVHFTGKAAGTASVQTNIQALLHFSPVHKPSTSHHLLAWLLLLAGYLQKAKVLLSLELACHLS